MATITATSTNNWASAFPSVPTAADDVVIPSPFTVTVPSATTVVARSVTVQASGGLTFAATTSILTIGDATAGAGNVAFSNAGTITLTGIGIINFISTSSTTQTITSGGQALPNVTFNGTGGKWQLADAMTTSGTGTTITLTKGSFLGNGKAITCGSLTTSGSLTRTLDITNCSVTCTATTAWTMTTVTGLTFTSTGSTITLNGTAAIFAGSSLSYGSIVMSGSGVATVTMTGTCVNFTRTGTASKVDALSISSNFTVTGTLTLGGNTTQGVNRLLVQSSVVGTQRAITATGAAVVINGDVDFMDIDISGSPSWTNTGSAYLGDALGNGTIITSRTNTPVTRYAVVAGNWSSTATWSATSGGAGGATVPLPQDTVILNANSAAGTYVADMPRMGKSLTATGFTRTLNLASGSAPTGGFSIYGDLVLTSVMTMNVGAANASITLRGRDSHIINMGGLALNFITGSAFFAIDAAIGTYTLASDINLTFGSSSTTSSLKALSGTFTTADYTVTASQFGATTGSATINLGSSTVNLTHTSPNSPGPWLTGASQTINASSSTIVISTASAGLRTFSGGGRTYGTLTYTVVNSPHQLLITGSNTFNTINVGSGRQLQFSSSTTNTVTNFNVAGANFSYLSLPGGSPGTYVSAPDIAAYTGAGIMRWAIRVALDDWTPSSAQTLFAHYIPSARGWDIEITSTGLINLQVSADGTNSTVNALSTAPSLVDGTTYWIGVEYNTATGATTFYKANDSVSLPTLWSGWTQINTLTATATTPFDVAQPIAVGARSDGTSGLAAGKFYRVQLYTNTSTLQFDANFTTKAFNADSFTESSSNAATVSMNGVATAGDGRLVINSSTAGTAATISKASGIVLSDYLVLQDITATGGASFYAGNNSVNVSNNTGWTFTGLPANITAVVMTATGQSSVPSISTDVVKLATLSAASAMAYAPAIVGSANIVATLSAASAMAYSPAVATAVNIVSALALATALGNPPIVAGSADIVSVSLLATASTNTPVIGMSFSSPAINAFAQSNTALVSIDVQVVSGGLTASALAKNVTLALDWNIFIEALLASATFPYPKFFRFNNIDIDIQFISNTLEIHGENDLVDISLL